MILEKSDREQRVRTARGSRADDFVALDTSLKTEGQVGGTKLLDISQKGTENFATISCTSIISEDPFWESTAGSIFLYMYSFISNFICSLFASNTT